MQQKQGYIEAGEIRLHYRRYGHGQKLLLAFHGYGNNATLFQSFERYLGNDYTIFSFDLPHHGNSEFHENDSWQRRDTGTLVKHMLKETGASKVSLMGYSMGARVCLCMAEQVPELIDKIVLLAPDGLVFNLLYYIATRTMAGQFLFKSFLLHKDRYRRYAEWLRRRKLLDESRYKFAMYYLEQEESRRFLLKVWPAMRYLIPDMNALNKIFQKHPIPVHVFMGKYDRVIPVKNAEVFSRGKNNVQVHVLDKGHRVFDSDTLPQIAQTLLEDK